MAKDLEKVGEEVGEEGEGEDDQQEEGVDVEAAKELLDGIKESMKQNKGRKY